MHYKRMRNHGSTEKREIDRRPLLDRFNEKYEVDIETGCWNWTGAKRDKGYGVINTGGRGPVVTAHRASYELFVGEIPSREGYHGTCVCHRCDNPSCVNPAHLFLGSVADNNKDMLEKGRGKGGLPKGYQRDISGMRRGSAHPMARLSDKQVVEIKKLLSSGFRVTDIAILNGVPKGLISRIKTGKSWTHIR